MKRLKTTINKYSKLLSIYMQKAIIYRPELLVWTVIDAMPLLMMVFLWISVYQGGSQIGKYNLNYLLTYYIIGHLISSLIAVHFEEEGVKQVKNGSIAIFLLKPFSYKHHIFISSLSWRIYKFLLTILPSLLLIILFLKQWVLTPSLTQIIWIIIFSLIGYCIDMILSLAIVATAFYFEEAKSLTHLKWILAGILGGSLLPLNLYPSWLETIARYLPFQYGFAVPLEIYLGQKTGLNIISSLFLGVVWIITLYLLINSFWHKAIKKFAAIGN